ncbi:hypothetical protein WDW86_21865 [Bdellovibrionota bacterium FG-2]
MATPALANEKEGLSSDSAKFYQYGDQAIDGHTKKPAHDEAFNEKPSFEL